MTDQFLRAAILILVLLNPFTQSVYLLDLIRSMDRRVFASVLARAVMISATVFAFFALTGELMFREVFQVRFASFLVFGGLVLLLIALRMIFFGSQSIAELRGGNPKAISGSIAMPFMIGPGTVSASVLAGTNLPPLPAIAAVVLGVCASGTLVFSFKCLHDWVNARNEELVERYTALVGRVSALIIGMIAVDMIMRGLKQWGTEVP